MLDALKRDTLAHRAGGQATAKDQTDPSLKPQMRAVPTPEPVDPRDRRGPFRPERLISLRERRSNDRYARLFRIGDILLITGFTMVLAQLIAPLGWMRSPVSEVLPFLTAVMVTGWALKSLNLYQFLRTENLLVHVGKVAAAVFLGALGGVCASQFSPNESQEVPLLGLWTLTALCTLTLMHVLWFEVVRSWRKRGLLTPNIVIVGATRHAQKLIDTALERRDVNILGIFDDRLARNPDAVSGVPILGDTQALLSHKITPYVDQIVVALDPSAKARVNHLIEKLKMLPNDVSLLVDVHNETGRQAALSRLSDMPLAKVSGISEDERKAFNKRFQDIIIGLIALVVFAPLMAIVALIIKLDSPGPVFFRQRRHGFNNEAINVWKFRSMRNEAADATASRQISRNDDRVTRVGKFIRKTSIDELPQLFNVLKGEMSLVGPRPHAIGMKTGPDESARLVAEYAWRHRMKPGMTGWAAINGSRGALETADDVRRRIQLDVDYIERHSLWLDLYIMAMTIPCVLNDRSAIR
ncbi:undecaprenyl-phosphate glucose phosphotransferase [Asticcacaulis sp. YBE204]|uniref:undecaprenyl-phosphate glucose phosphotransferase n=1 Tax=Asticcacaulis sp. YBE204 TaxID=1282363 RepID=UPI0003C3F044|nr:undecaprenyl-phosphate glucose phosphotransferase [Asticcacaulis sp. YBE204]ESQ76922.1 hypothetical protein AEYBE204_18780 [Asticcacaulis sp. YBE204]